MIKPDRKVWRSDLNVWETTYLLFKRWKVYKYGIWKNGKTKNRWRLKMMQPETALPIDSAKKLPEIVIGNKELSSRYGGNKWLVPSNIKHDPNID